MLQMRSFKYNHSSDKNSIILFSMIVYITLIESLTLLRRNIYSFSFFILSDILTVFCIHHKNWIDDFDAFVVY